MTSEKKVDPRNLKNCRHKHSSATAVKKMAQVSVKITAV